MTHGHREQGARCRRKIHSCDSTTSTFSFALQEEAPGFTIISVLLCHFLQGHPGTQQQIARSSPCQGSSGIRTVSVRLEPLSQQDLLISRQFDASAEKDDKVGRETNTSQPGSLSGTLSASELGVTT